MSFILTSINQINHIDVFTMRETKMFTTIVMNRWAISFNFPEWHHPAMGAGHGAIGLF